MSAPDRLLTQIDRLKVRLDTVRPLTSEQLQRALDIEYTFESNRIEGNTLTLRETDLVVNKGLTVGGKSGFILLIAGHVRHALQTLLQRLGAA